MTNKLIKKSYLVNMVYDITDAEILRAKQSLFFLKKAKKALDLASKYLNNIKTPFKDNSNVSSEEINKERFYIRQFRDESVNKFNAFKAIAFKCVFYMQEFSSDTQTVKIMKSFITSIDELQGKVNKFVDLFDDLESKEFSKNLVEKIEGIQKHCNELEDIIENRIISHIHTNILASTWVDSVSTELKMNIEKKTPLAVELYRQRQEELQKEIK